MTMQAMGDYAAAKAMLEKMGVVRPPVQAVLDKLTDVPVDIEPRFVTAEQLTRNRNVLKWIWGRAYVNARSAMSTVSRTVGAGAMVALALAACS